jgi:alpha-mannosidase
VASTTTTDRPAEVGDTLARLRAAALAAQAWPVMHWKTVSGPGPADVEFANSTFQKWALEPGQPVTLAGDFTLPEQIAATPIAGDALDVMLLSCFPASLSWNGTSLLAEDLPSVAVGPALVRVCPMLQAGANGELRLTIHTPQNQTSGWHQMYFSTPRLRARFALLDLAWARLALAAHLATTADDLRAVQRALLLVPSDLETLSTGELATHLDRLPEALAPLSARMAALRVYVVGHSHIDMNWLWTWPDTREVIKRDMRSVLALMDEYPEMTFTHSQPATYEVLQRDAPELFAHVLQRIQEGRWEPATMTWVEGDTNMASGEALSRHLLEAVAYSRRHLGIQPTVFMAPDTFGHAGTLPQLAHSGGATVYYHHRCNPGFTSPAQYLWPAYWWEGQDGTRLLAVSTPTYNGFITAGGLAEAAIAAHAQGQSASLFFSGVGDHGGGPARQSLDTLRSVQDIPGFLTARCGTIAAYARDVLDSGVALPVHRGESTTIFEGCYTTQAEIKQANRQVENVLCTADTLAALAGLPHADAQAEAWRKLLFHQFHDILDGSAIHESYRQSVDDYRAATITANATIDRALELLQSATAPGQIAVTNPLGFDRRDVVIVPELQGEGAAWLRDAGGSLTPGQFTAAGLCFVASLSAFATGFYRLAPDESLPLPPAVAAVPAVSPPAALQSQGRAAAADGPYYLIETAAYRVYLRRDAGILVSLYDKQAARELVGYGMRRFSDYPETARTDLALNVLQILDELPNEMSAWHLDEVQRETSFLRGATTRIVETGPVRLVVEVRHSVRSSTVTQLLAFYRDLPRIDVEATIDWRESGGESTGIADLKIAFTTCLDDCQAWFETPFGAVRRPSGGQEVPALRWVDVGGPAYGLAILNDGRYGFDVLGNRLRMTLVRGAYYPDAIADQGSHVVRYGIFAHAGDWRDAGVVEQAAGFNQPLLGRVGTASSGQTPITPAMPWRPRLSPGSVVVACLKPAHGPQGQIMRLYESAGRSADVTLSGLPPAAHLLETNVVEDPIAPIAIGDGSVRLSFRPWQVRTLLVTV